MKITVLDGHALNPGDLSWSDLSNLGEITVYDRTATLEEAVQRIGDSEILLINKFPVTAELLDRCPSVKAVFVLATGYNVVDCAAARARNIPVCNVPTYGTDAVAQFTFALILAMCHRVEAHSASVHDGTWTNCPDFCYWLSPQMELAGKTLGIVGFGRIGRAVARIARGFGMKVIATSRTETAEGAALAEYVPLEALMKRSDIVTLHCPLFPETEKIINKTTIAMMKDGAMLVNTSRGGLIDEQAVADALASGKLRSMAADVVTTEPITDANPLLTAPNCILTPHIAWAPVESRQRLMNTIVDNVKAFLAGTPQNVVNGI